MFLLRTKSRNLSQSKKPATTILNNHLRWTQMMASNKVDGKKRNTSSLWMPSNDLVRTGFASKIAFQLGQLDRLGAMRKNISTKLEKAAKSYGLKTINSTKWRDPANKVMPLES